MASQSACSSFLSSNRCFFPQRFGSTSGVIPRRDLTFQPIYTQKAFAIGLKWTKGFPHVRLNRAVIVIVSALNSGPEISTGGKPGSVSLEEEKLEYAPLKPETGSFFWTAGPLALIMSFAISPKLVGAMLCLMTREKISLELLVCLSSEAALYAGLATFLLIMDRAQIPYLRFSAKRLSLVTGLKEFITSSAFCMKIVLPLVAVYFTYPHLGTDGLVATTPFLASSVAQILFEISPKFRGSSYWPLVPIIFEVYRVYRLTHGVCSLEQIVRPWSGASTIPQKLAVGGMLLTIQVLGVMCLWSLITFLFRLFPSRSVGDY